MSALKMCYIKKKQVYDMEKEGKMLEIIRKNQGFLDSNETKKRNRMKEKNFTRNRLLQFKFVVGLILNMLKKSLKIEIDDFYEYVLNETGGMTVTKQAFSKARQNLNPNIFKELADIAINHVYADENYKKHDEYRFLAVDGTTIELPNLEKLEEYFGNVGNKAETVRARASALIDIENEIIIDSEIGNYRDCERNYCKRHLKKLKELGYRKDLILYDRGYPSRELMAYHMDEGIDFLMRAKETFLHKKTIYAGETDCIKEFTYKDNIYKVRRVEFMLNSGEKEVLITSISDKLSIQDLKVIYFKRWGIETKFNTLKHKIQIENFSGYSTIAILQDFYASMYLSNIAAIFKMDIEISDNTDRKYTYKVNENLLIGKLKNRLVKAFLFDDYKYAAAICERIIKEVGHNIIPIRPDRKVSRLQTHKPIKYPQNMRKSL